ncbi:MAG: hypothetical protein ABII00_09430 [Elusimicrobiota bacterium]
MKFDDHCADGFHFRADDLERGVERGVLEKGRPAGAGSRDLRRAVVSQVCRSLTPSQRERFFSGLRRRAGRGARLAVFDDLAAPSLLERDRFWLSSGGSAPEASPIRARELAGELGRCGWRLRAEPESLSAAGSRWTVFSTEAA